MKQLICEMCGGTDLVKNEGVFVCQICGCKYSVEEAKKMMAEGTVDVKGTVKVDTSEELNNLYLLARRAKDTNRTNAAKYYGQILVKDPMSWEANFYSIYFAAWEDDGCGQHPCSKISGCLDSVYGLIKTQVNDEQEQNDAIKSVYDYTIEITDFMSTNNKLKTTDIITKAVVETGINQIWDKLGDAIFSYFSDRSSAIHLAIVAWNKAIGAYKEQFKLVPDQTGTFTDPIKEKINKAEETLRTEVAKVEAQKKQVAIDEYWKNHSSERAELESEKVRLEAQLTSIKAQYDEIMSKRNEGVDELRKIRDRKTAEEEASDKQQDLIRDLERQKSSLGLFKGKEKKKIQARIAQEQLRLGDMRKVAQTAKEQHQATINEQIKEMQHIGQNIIDEYSGIKARISEITTELTKER